MIPFCIIKLNKMFRWDQFALEMHQMFFKIVFYLKFFKEMNFYFTKYMFLISYR